MFIIHPKRIRRKTKEWYRKNFCRSENVILPSFRNELTKDGLRATHISAFSYDNAGDALLPVILRELFNQFVGIKSWYGVDVHQQVSQKDVWFYNHDDIIVIGGGGLFLCDTCPNENSGWQWNCSIDYLRKIKKPIIAFAIGYNRFRGQEEFKPVFTKHINAFVEQASFVGIRNNGSIEKIKRYLKTEELKNKLVFQPCMTTLIAKIFPNLYDYHKKENFIAFNCAFDRQQMRSLNENRLESIAKVAQLLSKQTTIKYYSHMPSDNLFLPYFEKYKVPYELVEMTTIDSIISNYCKPRLVIGMRGHAQMIPFGCLTPIISIISHDKMLWFLEDIHHSEWGVDVLDNKFEEKLFKIAVEAYNNTMNNIDEIEYEQQLLWDTTMANLISIKNVIKKHK